MVIVTVLFALTGGMTPEAPVLVATRVELDVALVKAPEDTVALGVAEEPAGLVTLAEDGGTTPESPVRVDTAVPPENEKLPTPPVENTLACGVLAAGGITPLAPVELVVRVLMPTVALADPEDTNTEAAVGALMVLLPSDGGMLTEVEEMLRVVVVVLVISTTGIEEFTVRTTTPLVAGGETLVMDRLPERGVLLGNGERGASVSENVLMEDVTLRLVVGEPLGARLETFPVGLGGITPPPPVELNVAVEPDVLKAALPPVVLLAKGARGMELTPRVGVTTPLPPVEFVVNVADEKVRFAAPELTVTPVEFAGYVQLVMLEGGP